MGVGCNPGVPKISLFGGGGGDLPRDFIVGGDENRNPPPPPRPAPPLPPPPLPLLLPPLD